MLNPKEPTETYTERLRREEADLESEEELDDMDWRQEDWEDDEEEADDGFY